MTIEITEDSITEVEVVVPAPITVEVTSPGPQGAAGAKIYDGTAPPSNAVGVVGDYYIVTQGVTSLGAVYKKEVSGWAATGGNVRGAPGAGSVDTVNGDPGPNVTLDKTDIGLPNVDNTSDLNKPISTATQTALDGKAATVHVHSIANVTGLQAAIDGKAATVHTHVISDTTGLQAALDAKAADSDVVKLTGAQTIAGIKTFSASPVVPDGSFTIAKTTGLQSAIDAKAATSHIHTYESVPTLEELVNSTLDALPVFTSLIIQDDGYPTFGKITPDFIDPANVDGIATTASLRTLGTGAQQAAPGNHTHEGMGETWYELWDNTRGAALGYEAFVFVSDYNSEQELVKLTSDYFDPNFVDGTAAYPSLRTLGTGSQQAAAGNHAHTIANITSLQATLDAKVALTGNQTIAGVKTFSTAPAVPDASFTIAKTSGLQTALDAKAATSAVVLLTGAQTIAGIKTFSSSPVVPDSSFTIAKTTGLQAALDAKAATSHSHTAGQVPTFTSSLNTGITNSETNTSYSIIGYGSTGVLALVDLDANYFAAAAIDGVVGTASLRTLGTGAQQAAAGNHTHSASTIVTGTLPQAQLKPNVQRIVHGATAGTARPTGSTYVEWIGSVQPTNAISGDTWVNTA
jgi:hypothetical protein